MLIEVSQYLDLESSKFGIFEIYRLQFVTTHIYPLNILASIKYYNETLTSKGTA